ncbi:MAG TPA: prolyl oligopeptidase family serine peptidase [Flavisolibacter sp.]|nr:prolyl oligopeptidase family serine peptidase [Flavisolibacter sp.]
MVNKKSVAFFALLIVTHLCVTAQDGSYQTPPKDIADMVLAKPTPGVSIDGKAQWMLLLERSDFPTIEELAQPELRIAGLRINPNNFSPTRAGSSEAIRLKNIKADKTFDIDGLPKDLRATNVQWSPDETKFALVHNGNTQLDLYVVTVADKKARKVNSNPLNTVLGGSYQWSGNSELVYKTIVPGKALTAKPGAPSGPIAQENMGKAAASRTYQDLIKNAYDETLFEYYATAQLVKNDLVKETPIGAPKLYRSVSLSPDHNYILVTTIDKPFSYLFPASGFPHTVAILDKTGALVKTLVQNPSAEGQPIGFDDASTFPRGYNWRDDEPATITYVQALDKGLGKSKAPYRDALYAMDIRGGGAPKELFKTSRRFGGIVWGNQETAVFYERMNADRKVRMNRFNPTTGKVDSLFERSSNDAYSDIGTPMTQKNALGQQTLILLNGKELLLRSQGSSPEGDMPFVQTFDITNGKRSILWQSQAPYYETVVDVIDAQNGVFLTSREAPTEAPNYYIRNTKRRIAPIAITNFTNPYAGLEGIKREKISYKRDDGISLTGNLYLPKGFDPKKDKPLPVIMWAYPIEYKSAADAAQVRGSKYTFTRINYGSPIFWVTQGYAVLDAAEMPIVGEGGKEPNDNFIPQLHLNAHSAIKKLSEMGVGDSNRVAVGGHSYGAFMTANLLAHTKLFKAGIARSGAYNRSLTPFGFQGEERTYWEAPDVYAQMSPFNYADKIKTPLLLIHGELDNNTGTFPIQSERLYNAIKGHGGTVRYVVLPYESHGYSARENILHMLWEQNSWLDKWVKNADKNKPAQSDSNREF